MVAGVVLAISIGAVFLTKKPASLKLTIGGLEISEEEYKDIMQEQIYPVTRYFFDTYGAAVDGEFWEKDFQGEVPYQMLAEYTLEQLKYQHGVYEHAKRMGYVDSASYESLLERVETENTIRKEKIEKGEVVYGLSEYTKELYLEYEMDSFQKRYCDNIENEGMDISDEERQVYYEENKDVLYNAYDDLTLNYLRVPYEVEGAQESMTSLYKKMDAEHTMESLINGEFSQLKEYFSKLEITSSEYGSYAKTMPEVLEYSNGLEKGQSTQVIDDGTSFSLVECVNRVKHDYLPIDQVKDHINKALRESVYDDLMLQEAEKITVDYEIQDLYEFTKKNVKNK